MAWQPISSDQECIKRLSDEWKFKKWDKLTAGACLREALACEYWRTKKLVAQTIFNSDTIFHSRLANLWLLFLVLIIPAWKGSLLLKIHTCHTDSGTQSLVGTVADRQQLASFWGAKPSRSEVMSEASYSKSINEMKWKSMSMKSKLKFKGSTTWNMNKKFIHARGQEKGYFLLIHKVQLQEEHFRVSINSVCVDFLIVRFFLFGFF